jgi:hypothetical protein
MTRDDITIWTIIPSSLHCRHASRMKGRAPAHLWCTQDRSIRGRVLAWCLGDQSDSHIFSSAKSCAVLVTLRYLTHLVIFPSVHISSARMYVYRMHQASKMARQLVWFELCCVEILVWCEFVVLNFLSDTSCRPTVGINMKGLFLQEPLTAKQPRKFDKTPCRSLRADADFNLKTCRKRKSPQYKLKEETVLYLWIHL